MLLSKNVKKTKCTTTKNKSETEKRLFKTGILYVQDQALNVNKVGWDIASPFSRKISYIRDKVLGGDLVLPG